MGFGVIWRMELDETLCTRPVCQHPQCWVTLRRIEQGNPRRRPPHSRHPPQDEAGGGLPVLSVSTLPGSRVLHNGSDQHRVIVEDSRATVYNLYNSAAPCSMEKILFPGVSSYREIIAPSRRSVSCVSSRKPVQVESLDPAFQDTKSRDVTMVWEPNAQHRPPKKEDREKPPKVWIKDLLFTDPKGGMKREKQNADLTINKRQKPPTGGCPLNLTLVGSSPSPHTKNCMAARDVQEQPDASKCRRRRHDQWADIDSLTSPSLSGIMVENRRVVLHDTRERCPVVPHTGPVYRLDEQSVALNNMEVDLDSIRNQYYLWKKYIHLAGPSRRIKPPDHRASKTQRSHKSAAPDQFGHIGLFPYNPDSALSYYKSRTLETPTGSVVCDTTRSRDSESRNSPSLAGFSQRSWTDEEPSKTSAEMDDSKRIEQKNRETQPTKLTEARDVAPELTESEEKDDPGDQETSRPNPSPDRPESAVESPDVHQNPQQRMSSPQPNPPPPSPMH